MKPMNIAQIDLNLFVVFEAIYRERSITRAARALHLSQPAVSHALARLRERLGDPLFQRRGHDMVPTLRATALIVPVREALHQLQSGLWGEAGFEPSQARRTLVLGLGGGLEACLLPPLMARLQRQAPGLDVQTLAWSRRELPQALQAGMVDLAVDVRLPVDAGIGQSRLLDAPLTLALRSDHLLTRAASVTLEDYLAARHVLVSSRRRGPGLEDFALAEAGHHRTIAVRCRHYPSALATVAATDLLLTLPQIMARQGPLSGVVLRPLPVQLPPLSLFLYWSQEQARDPALIWLREQLLEVCESMR